MDHPITKLISGGQTGVDRAALDVALALGIPCGGWCPRGRRAEDGPLDARYPLVETSSAQYPERTQANVRDADGTLILARGKPQGGTALTVGLARGLNKPFLLLDLEEQPDPGRVRGWILFHHIHTLNVAGPREGDKPGIYEQVASFLRQVFAH